jgi:hypothetical protein
MIFKKCEFSIPSKQNSRKRYYAKSDYESDKNQPTKRRTPVQMIFTKCEFSIPLKRDSQKRMPKAITKVIKANEKKTKDAGPNDFYEM